ncbi:GNAT family N-acetyltransferase [Pseudophaeobacter sp.]|uniref:GNAT family N-acetyltransferase n=1 Tax=Pseudophaeobacter sp. TaxID=1971739 RepID=UPI003298520B
MTAPTLQTDRLILRPHGVEDFDEVAALWADPQVVKYIGGAPNSAEQSWARLLRYIGHWQALGFGYWAVCDRESGEFLGEVGFANYRREISPPLPEVPEAGWVLATKAHGRGLASEAVGCIHHWADQVQHWPQTVAIFAPEHAASQQVAAKQGYQTSGEAAYFDEKILVMSRQRSASV